MKIVTEREQVRQEIYDARMKLNSGYGKPEECIRAIAALDPDFARISDIRQQQDERYAAIYASVCDTCKKETYPQAHCVTSEEVEVICVECLAGLLSELRQTQGSVT